MSLIKKLFWGLLIVILALALFAPDTFDDLKEGALEKIRGSSVTFNTSSNQSFVVGYETLVNETPSEEDEELSEELFV